MIAPSLPVSKQLAVLWDGGSDGASLDRVRKVRDRSVVTKRRRLLEIRPRALKYLNGPGYEAGMAMIEALKAGEPVLTSRHWTKPHLLVSIMRNGDLCVWESGDNDTAFVVIGMGTGADL